MREPPDDGGGVRTGSSGRRGSDVGPGDADRPVPIRWTEDGCGLLILDQTALPERRVERELRTVDDVEEAIGSLRVRGAPLIGITAAMGVAALARSAVRGAGPGEPDREGLARRVESWCDRLVRARPTAVNLKWALERMRRIAGAPAAEAGASPDEGPVRPRDRDPEGGSGEPSDAGPAPEGARALAGRLAEEADRIREEDRRMCRRIGEHAVSLLRDGAAAVTHCNTGALATGGIGTALAPIYVAHERGWRVRVFADETRPLLQGSRLTAWELEQAGVDVTVISDGMAGTLMSQERPDVVMVGSDRIAANGDVANKVGTYGLAVLAHHHDIPFYVLAPTSTVDLETPSGDEIPIEHRAPDEIRRGFGRLTAPADADVWSPAFDVTPARLVTGIVTEQGICEPPYEVTLAEAVERAGEERARDAGAVGALGE